jgi:DinB family protein
MDAITFFLSRYNDLHGGLVDGLFSKLSEAQLRGRPHPGVNTVAWLLWHSARIEDVGVNRFLSDRPQALDEGWLERLRVGRRDVGTGMSDAEVDELSLRIDLVALRGYWDAVTERTLAVVETVKGTDLEAVVPGERVKSVVLAEDVVAPGAEWLTEFWAEGRSRAWVLAQMGLLHPYGHYYEARVASGLWGVRSP